MHFLSLCFLQGNLTASTKTRMRGFLSSFRLPRGRATQNEDKPYPSTVKTGKGTQRKERLSMNIRIAFLLWIGMCLGFSMLTSQAQGFDQVIVSPVVNVVTPPKYSLWEGVDIAINSVINTGTTVSIENVIKELEDMQDRHEVSLPYSYSGRKKSEWLKPKDRQAKTEFKAKVKRRLAVVLSENPRLASAVPAEPQPALYESRKEFIDAYASYRVKDADEDIRAQYAKKLAGMNEYRREMKREAELIWKQASKR